MRDGQDFTSCDPNNPSRLAAPPSRLAIIQFPHSCLFMNRPSRQRRTYRAARIRTQERMPLWKLLRSYFSLGL
jgi:hypothetical protein